MKIEAEYCWNVWCTRQLLGMNEALYIYLHFIYPPLFVYFLAHYPYISFFSLVFKLLPARMHFKNVADANELTK